MEIKLNKGKGLDLDKEAITKLQETQIESIKGGRAAVEGGSKVCTCSEVSCNTQSEAE